MLPNNRALNLKLTTRRVTLALTCCVIFLHLANIPAVWIRYNMEHEGLPYLYMLMFSVSSEGRLPTWYSALTLVFCGLLLFLIAKIKSNKQDTFARYWWVLGAIFLLMSLDEATQIHELANGPVQRALNTKGMFLFAWVIPGSIFVLIIVLSYLRFLLHLPRKTRFLFLAGGIVFVSGALGIEIVSSYYFSLHGRDITYGIISTIEEIFEMSGILIFIYGLLDYLEREIDTVKISFVKRHKHFIEPHAKFSTEARNTTQKSTVET